jgi:hypothetical protein
MFPIVATGNYPISRGINLITINVNANVTINLPSAKAGLPGSLPGQWFLMPITIVDIGGFAPGNSYIINPFGTELISGLASIQLSSSFGAFLLKPILETGGWTLLQ